MNNTAKQVGQNASEIAKKIARQIADEPVEILKDAASQVSGLEVDNPKNTSTGSSPNQTKSENGQNYQEELKDKAFANHRLQALQSEIEDIRKQEVVKILQNKISQGDQVSLEDYPELSMEQKQVLKAQIDAVKQQMLNAKYANDSLDVPSVHSKPSRRFGAGQKHEAEKAQTRVEKPIQPSQ